VYNRVWAAVLVLGICRLCTACMQIGVILYMHVIVALILAPESVQEQMQMYERMH
jgi:hypothetical protein